MPPTRVPSLMITKRRYGLLAKSYGKVSPSSWAKGFIRSHGVYGSCLDRAAASKRCLVQSSCRSFIFKAFGTTIPPASMPHIQDKAGHRTAATERKICQDANPKGYKVYMPRLTWGGESGAAHPRPLHLPPPAFLAFFISDEK